MWSSIIRIMFLPLLLLLFLMGNNVHCLRKVKLGGKDCTFKVREIIYIYFLSKNGVEEVFFNHRGRRFATGR